MATGAMVPEEHTPSTAYPPPAHTDVKQDGRNYQDEAAADLYKAAGGPKIMRAHAAAASALVKQAEKIEEFHNSPFTTKQTKMMLTTMEVLERLERVAERWHLMIYPNQRPSEGHDVG